MDISNDKKLLLQLNDERTSLIQSVLKLREKDMIKGKLYQSARVCGNPNCKCAKGEKHVSWYLIISKDGRSRQEYVGAVVPFEIQERVDRFRNYKLTVQRTRSIDKEISQLLNTLRDSVSVPMKEFKIKKKVKHKKL